MLYGPLVQCEGRDVNFTMVFQNALNDAGQVKVHGFQALIICLPNGKFYGNLQSLARSIFDDGGSI